MFEAAPVAGPRSVRVQIGGADYQLSLDLGELARAELWYRSQGSPCNLVTALPVMTERAIAAIEVFSCSLHARHPEINPIHLIAQGNLQKIAETLNQSWPAASSETQEANRNLCFDLDALAEASEYFAVTGNGTPLAVLLQDLSLAACMNIFPCALRRFRPELTFVEAQMLMDLQSVYAVAMYMATAWRVASPEERERFSLRAVRRNTWTGIARA